MKRLLVLSYVIAIHLLVVALLLQPQLVDKHRWRLGLPESEPTAFGQATHNMYRAVDREAAKGLLVILGDSHVQRMPSDLLPAKHLSLGIGGDTVRNLRNRLIDYQSLPQARLIAIWAGYNDLRRRTVDEVAIDMKALLASLPADRAVLLLGLPPAGTDGSHGVSGAQLAALNRHYAKLCSSPCQFLDLGPLLAVQDGELDPRYDAGDGIHLNRAGYSLVAGEIVQADKLGTTATGN